MTQSKKALRKSTRLTLVPKKTLVRKGSKYFSRDLCGQIYGEYVDAYLKNIKTGQFTIPTMMFVFKDKSQSDTPIVIPYDLDNFSDGEVKKAALDAVQRNEGNYLDLIMYAQFEEDHKKKGTYSVMFGCRDALGNTIHRMYGFNAKNKTVRIKNTLPFSNNWTPPVGSKKKVKYDRLTDSILIKAATDYTIFLASK